MNEIWKNNYLGVNISNSGAWVYLTAKLPPFFVSLSQTSTALRKSLGVLSIPQCLQANHAFACQMQATGTGTVLVIADDTLTDNKVINVIFL